MALKVGEAAPTPALFSAPRTPLLLGDYISRQSVVLLFFPLAFSPVCTDEMCRMRDDWSQWEKLGAKVFGISVDSPFVTDKFRAEMDIPFPILSDFNKEVASRYGVLHEELVGLRGVAKRSAFVIDSDGTVAYAWVSDDPKQVPKFDELQSALTGARAGA